MGVPRQALEIGDVARPGKGLNEKRELIAPLGGGCLGYPAATNILWVSAPWQPVSVGQGRCSVVVA